MKNQRIKKTLFIICSLLLTFSFTASAQTDLRIKKKSRMSFPNMPAPMKNPQTGEMMDFGKMPDSVVLIKGARMLTEIRHEPKGGKKTVITKLLQCDLGRELMYNNKSKKYTATYFSSSPKTPVKGKPIAKETGGTVTFSMTDTDTGERQEMFGYTARRVKSVMTSKPSPDTCEKKTMKMETDGWYIDLPTLSCSTFSAPEQFNEDGMRHCNDKIIFQVSGKADKGFAVKETMTITAEGNPPFSLIHEVTEISKTELDAQLFDVPPGYTENKNVGTKTAPDNTAQNDDDSPSTVTPNSSPIAPTTTTNTTETALKPKKPGVIRIGIAKPSVKMPGDKDDTTAPLVLSSAVRDSLVDTLKAETVEAIRLNSDAPESEAKQTECDYIFYANVTQKRGGGGMFGKMIAMGAISVAGAMVPGIGGMVASTVASQVMSQQMGKIAKAKDEFTFDYKVTDINAAVMSKAVTKAKAKEDGEDVLTPLIKQASTTVMGEIGKNK